MALHQIVGGSTGPGFSLKCFQLKEKKLTSKNNPAFIWVSAAIERCVFI